jgi:hypothetical protein
MAYDATVINALRDQVKLLADLVESSAAKEANNARIHPIHSANQDATAVSAKAISVATAAIAAV